MDGEIVIESKETNSKGSRQVHQRESDGSISNSKKIKSNLFSKNEEKNEKPEDSIDSTNSQTYKEKCDWNSQEIWTVWEYGNSCPSDNDELKDSSYRDKYQDIPLDVIKDRLDVYLGGLHNLENIIEHLKLPSLWGLIENSVDSDWKEDANEMMISEDEAIKDHTWDEILTDNLKTAIININNRGPMFEVVESNADPSNANFVLFKEYKLLNIIKLYKKSICTENISALLKDNNLISSIKACCKLTNEEINKDLSIKPFFLSFLEKSFEWWIQKLMMILSNKSPSWTNRIATMIVLFKIAILLKDESLLKDTFKVITPYWDF